MEKNKFFFNLFFSGLINHISTPHIPDMDKKYWVNNKCSDCKICYKVCPAMNIKMINNKPEWQHKCEQCLACIHWCPIHAIQYGKKTESRSRYHYPDVKVSELFVNE